MRQVGPLVLGSIVIAACLLQGCGGGQSTSLPSQSTTNDEKIVNLYIWVDYLPPDTLATFEKQTGIKVNVTYFDTLAVPETRLLTGHTGFDVVITSPPFFHGLVSRGVFQSLKRPSIPNLTALDPQLMQTLTTDDPGNAYGVILTWGTYGITFNEKQFAAALPGGPPRSWGAIFDPRNAQQLAKCHLNFLDSPAGVVPIALQYLGKDPRNPGPSDLQAVESMLSKIRPYVHNIDTAGQIDAMANGEVCAAFDSNGDAIQSHRRAKEAGNGVSVNMAIPAEGSLLWFDLLAIPADAPHADNAHRLINFLLEPHVLADITRFVGFANASTAATSLLDSSIATDPIIYPPPETRARLIPVPEYPPETTRAITRLWQKFKTGQ